MNKGVEIRVKGLMLERFVDQCAERGVSIARAWRSDIREMRLITDERGAKIAMALAEKYGFESEVMSRSGAAKQMRWLRNHAALLIGCLITATALLFMTAHVWLVEVQMLGDEWPEGTLERIEQLLADEGVAPGTLSFAIDRDALALHIQLQMPELSFVNVRLWGIQLTVEASAENPSPDLYEIAAARDLVAACDAVVVSVDALTGQAAVKPGDTVRAGQVLIRGEERATDAAHRGVRALGVVMARVWHSGEAEASLSGMSLRDTGRYGLSGKLKFMEYEWPLVEGNHSPIERDVVERMPVVGLFLPVHIIRTIHMEQEWHEEPVDRAQAEREAGVAAMQAALLKAGDADVVERWVEFTVRGDVLHARAVVETRVDIAMDRQTWAMQAGD